MVSYCLCQCKMKKFPWWRVVSRPDLRWAVLRTSLSKCSWWDSSRRRFMRNAESWILYEKLVQHLPQPHWDWSAPLKVGQQWKVFCPISESYWIRKIWQINSPKHILQNLFLTPFYLGLQPVQELSCLPPPWWILSPVRLLWVSLLNGCWREELLESVWLTHKWCLLLTPSSYQTPFELHWKYFNGYNTSHIWPVIWSRHGIQKDFHLEFTFL